MILEKYPLSIPRLEQVPEGHAHSTMATTVQTMKPTQFEREKLEVLVELLYS